MSNLSLKLFEFWFRSAPVGAFAFYTYGVYDNINHFKGIKSLSTSNKTLIVLGSSIGLGITGVIWPMSLPILCYNSYLDKKN